MNRLTSKLGRSERTSQGQGFLQRAQGIIKAAPDMRTLTPQEAEWKMKIYQRLLEVMDLSLIGTLPEDQARAHIREIAMRLMSEESATLSLEQR
ncbi:MAG: CpaF family protein, partial [Gammaproteobacteria bacterium]|nr:CpaF family protein [Gammaproteobacteria bacterium]